MRPDPIAALAEAWGRELLSVCMSREDAEVAAACRISSSVRRSWADDAAEEAAIAKRARRAAKRAEDERRTAEGRSRELNQPWRRGPMGLWDWPAIVQLPDPQWRIRSRERRANPALYMRDRGAL